MYKIDVDIDALYSLKGAINRFSNDITEIGKSIDTYLQGTIDSLQKTLDYFQERLDIAQREVDKAKEELYRAECAYESCLRSQRPVEDEDGHTYYTPSCSFQGARVNVCRKAVQQAENVRDVWQKKVDAAERIKSDCVREIDRYNDPGGFLHSPGGRQILLNLAEDHSNKAISSLDNTINALEDILSFSFETGESVTSTESTSVNEMNDIEYSDEMYTSKGDKFKEGKRKVDELIEEKYGDTSKPNVFQICPNCGKFKYVDCICERGQRERER